MAFYRAVEAGTSSHRAYTFAPFLCPKEVIVPDAEQKSVVAVQYRDGMVGLFIEPTKGEQSISLLWSLADARYIGKQLLDCADFVERHPSKLA